MPSWPHGAAKEAACDELKIGTVHQHQHGGVTQRIYFHRSTARCKKKIYI